MQVQLFVHCTELFVQGLELRKPVNNILSLQRNNPDANQTFSMWRWWLPGLVVPRGKLSKSPCRWCGLMGGF